MTLNAVFHILLYTSAHFFEDMNEKKYPIDASHDKVNIFKKDEKNDETTKRIRKNRKKDLMRVIVLP